MFSSESIESFADSFNESLGFGKRFRGPAPYSVEAAPAEFDKGLGAIWRSSTQQPHEIAKGDYQPGYTYDERAKTAYDVLVTSVSDFPDAPCHGVRVIDPATGLATPGFAWTSYADTLTKVHDFASGLVHLDALGMDETGRFKVCGLMGKNAPEWCIAEYAIFSQSGTTSPFYDSLSKETLAFLLEQNGSKTVVCDPESAVRLVAAKTSGNPAKFVNLIIYGPSPSAELLASIQKAGLTYHSFADVVEIGRKNPHKPNPPTENDVYSLVFTSGSTGSQPKAALISQKAAVTNASCVLREFESQSTKLRRGKDGEFHISFLPCAHAMERTMELLMMMVGGATGFSQGIRERIMEDVISLRPTVFAGVPRILNRIHDKICNTAMEAGGVKALLFKTGLNAKKFNLRDGFMLHPIWDRLIFSKIRAKIGLDRCRTIITGSAPIAPNVLDFFRCMGLFVMEGYGATELTCVATGTNSAHFSSGHVGGVASLCEIRLCDVPSMKYLVKDTAHPGIEGKVIGRGEICVRGPCRMLEYYRNKEATDKAIDADGFYHTGDVGCVLPDGTFRIIDRISSITKLSNGEFVAPESVENIALRASLVAQIYIHGDALHPHLVAIAVPDVDTIGGWAKLNAPELLEGEPKPQELLEALCKKAEFHAAVLAEIDKECRAAGLRSFEIPKKLHLESELFTPENVLTPTFKLQRPKARALYSEKLVELLGPEA